VTDEGVEDEGCVEGETGAEGEAGAPVAVGEANPVCVTNSVAANSLNSERCEINDGSSDDALNDNTPNRYRERKFV
jgi:hypothetical protein